MSPKPAPRFPLPALVAGGIGTLAAIAGILAYSAPDVAVRIWPLLEHRNVANALIAMGAVFMTLEMVLILRWIRHRHRTADSPADSPVVRTRNRN